MHGSDISLHKLVRALEEARLLQAFYGRIENTSVNHLTADSRQVGPHGLFVAVRGETHDGHMFLDKAVQNGAIALACEAMPATLSAGIAYMQVSNARSALAELATTFYDHPSREMDLIGITGTNGKTTTSFLIHHMLTGLGRKTGLMGTIECRIGDMIITSDLTTPDAVTLNRLLRDMRMAECTACVMETSSHALDQERVRALHYKVGVFSNLSHDHLDYHGTTEQYLLAKKRLFDGLASDAVAVFNYDDPAGAKMVADTKARPLSYGMGAGADIRVEMLENRLAGLRLRIDGTTQVFNLVGRFNAYNLTAAYAVGRALGYASDTVRTALATAQPVPGRFEQLRFDNNITVIVDYSHTPDALENVLRTIRETKSEASELWCIFGCGGDRDPAKRPVMGALAERYADHVIATSDNPRTEDPERILADIRPGMERPEEAVWLVNRREAIQYAARHVAPGDVVLISGKGHEPYQILGTEKIHFDDREEARRWFVSA